MGRSPAKKSRRDPGVSGSAWFGATIRPDAPVMQYAAAPPRGMTNPPRNPKVREALLKELIEYGIALEAPSWPTPSSRSSPTAAAESPGMTARQGDMPATAVPIGGRTGSHSQGVSPSLTARMRGTLKKGTGGSQSLPQLDLASSSSRSVMGVAPAKSTTVRSGGGGSSRFATLGAGIPQQEAVQSPTRSGRENCSRRGDSSSDGGGHESGGTLSPHHSSNDQSSTKHGGSWHQSSRLRRILTESELHDGMEALRSQGRLHRATVDVRFRAGPDVSAPQPPGNEPLKDPPSWANDASHLIHHHNQAMRSVNPSRLGKLPEIKKKRRKRDEDDEMHLSQSGLFRAQYPADHSLRTLRDLKVTLFPHPVPEAKEPEKTPDEDKIEVISRLKAEMSASFSFFAKFSSDLG